MNLRTLFTVLMATIVAVLWACTATASATVLTTDGGKIYTGAVKAENQGSIVLKGPVEVKCSKSTMEGGVESHGSEVPAEVKLSSLTFSECGSDTVSVVKSGALELSSTSEGNGTVKSTGAEITLQVHRTVLGIPITTHCIYTTNKTAIGNFTGSISTLDNPKLDVGPAPLPQSATDGACGSETNLTGSYKVTAPSVLLAISKFEEAELEISPKVVIFAGTEKPKMVNIENIGTVNLELVDVSIGWLNRSHFSAPHFCKNEELTAKGTPGTDCEESVECFTLGKEGRLFVWAEPWVVKTAVLEC